MTQDDPRTQTNVEWLADYSNAPDKPTRSEPAVLPPCPVANTKTLYRYIDHRTTTAGGITSVVLEFESIDSGIRAVRFFNVSLRSTRGNSYPASNRGQFNPRVNGKFREFWLNAVGKPPVKWCRVHKSMRSALSQLVFTGETVRAVDRKGREYIKLTEITLNV